MPNRARKEGDLPLASLVAFVATAHHLSYEEAAVELGGSASSVKRRVEHLERWLHKLLLLDDVQPLELCRDGESFLPVVVQSLAELASILRVAPVYDISSGNVDGLGLAALRALCSFEKRRGYKEVAADMGVSHNQVRRYIEKLQIASGERLVTGFSRVNLTLEGRRVVQICKTVLTRLDASIAFIPSDYNPHEKALRRGWMQCAKLRARVSIGVSRIERRKAVRQADLRKLRAFNEQASILTLALEQMSEFAPKGGREIKLDNIAAAESEETCRR